MNRRFYYWGLATILAPHQFCHCILNITSPKKNIEYSCGLRVPNRDTRYGRSGPPLFNLAKFGAGCFWVSTTFQHSAECWNVFILALTCAERFQTAPLTSLFVQKAVFYNLEPRKVWQRFVFGFSGLARELLDFLNYPAI